ncbi:MAG: MFS transporter [Synechococcaceae cyanobacterium RL_1_2]|nr:MFS transporter [Synechococcaceae cyanobacterium RL_1_2]
MQGENLDITPEENSRLLTVLKNPKFLLLWSGQIFSQLADKIYLVLMVAILSRDFSIDGDGISSWVSAIMIAFTLPAVFFGSVAGVYVDRWSKQSVLVGSNLIRGLLVLMIPALIHLSQGQKIFSQVPLGFGLLLIITFLVSTLTQFFSPAEQAIIPLIVERSRLLAANSLYTSTMMVAINCRFCPRQPLLSWSEQQLNNGQEILVGSSYLIAGLILLTLITREKQADLAQDEKHPLEDIKDGIAYLNTNLPVRNAIIQLILLFSIFAALAVLAVPLAAAIPTIEPDQFGLLLSGAGLGMGIGAFALGNWGHNFRYSKLSFYGGIGVSIALAMLGLVGEQSLYLTLSIISFLGLTAALVVIPMQTTIQVRTPEQMRGKVFGLQNNAVNIALSLPLAIAGIAAANFGLTAVLLTLAAITLGCTLLLSKKIETTNQHS